jgi:hypothetical protein
MISLKSLDLRFMRDQTEAEILPSTYKSLKPNASIKSLRIRHSNHPRLQVKHILAVMNLCPNLNSLYVSSLTPTLARAAAYHLKLLRSITYMRAEGDAVNEYEVLKNSGDESVNKFIKFSIELLG